MRTDVRMGDASMTYTEEGNYDFIAAEFFVRGGPRYGGRFNSRKGVVGALLLPKGEPVGGYVLKILTYVLVRRRRGFIRQREMMLQFWLLSQFSRLHEREPRRR